MDQPTPSLRARVRAHYLRDEAAALRELLEAARLEPGAASRVQASARALVEKVRSKRKVHGGMQSFLREYDLSSAEGVLLMCVAEALLRIPDAATADKLIRDKLSQGDWERHVGRNPSLLVNAGTWGMMLTGRLVNVEPEGEGGAGAWFSRLVARAGEPVVRVALRQGMRLMAEQFVMGRTIDEALARGAEGPHARYRHSFDMLGEAAFTAADAERYCTAYERAIDAIARHAAGHGAEGGVFARPGISIKLSALHPRYEFAQRERVRAELVPRVQSLVERARAGDVGVTLDAEEADRLDLSLDVLERVFASRALAGWEGFGLAVQAYQKRAPFVIDWLAELARRQGRRLMVRLVKGAYWDTEVKRAQVQGLAGYPVFTRKCNTDVSYLACARRILEAPEAFYGQFATHNAHTVATILERSGAFRAFEFQRLHGMGEDLYDEVVAAGHACRVYAPVGSHEDLLPYLVRRLLENGANTSFVNRIADPAVAIENVVADPVALAASRDGAGNPRIPLPSALYGDRRNSSGIAFADEAASAPLLAGLAPLVERTDFAAAPIVSGAQPSQGPVRDVVDPSSGRAIGRVVEADASLARSALAAACRARIPAAEERAAILERAADLIEGARTELLALLAREAGKTLPDGLGEVREAADFCRYYAMLAKRDFASPVELAGPTGETNRLALSGRGPFVCISPWNFPLAIFVGQVAAAYAAGNAVVAKPAGQTPLVAHRAVRLLHEAGIAPEALGFVPGRGETVGAALVADRRAAGVCFTGSTATAQAINRVLAARDGPIVPFIAETGGLNAMLVDSSALPEQVVADVVASAFDSAGQRCSALRILCLQEEIAPRVIELLAGATAELRLGDPARLDTDVGPVIDAEALALLEAHAARMDREARLLCKAEMPAAPGGTFFAPRAYEIASLEGIDREVFGPILHVVRFSSANLASVVDGLNAKGYGLTMGVHSRIEETVELVRSRCRAGNLYVNRNMIGATVGVQPFGGEGLSGTGPKAGGPHYLQRFATERTVTVNTAAAGGNASLIAGSE
jgi:RHH-type proline utilization regulon transcriptional repressor/proline dehydrogenase/delta 1-pyrroline-5-carboxylate dehydrogenase